MLKNEPTLAIGGVDTEENEHCKVCPLSVYRSPRLFSSPEVLRRVPEDYLDISRMCVWNNLILHYKKTPVCSLIAAECLSKLALPSCELYESRYCPHFEYISKKITFGIQWYK